MRAIAIVLITSIFAIGIPGANAQQRSSAGAQSTRAEEADAWRKVAETIPLGSKVKVQIADGKRVNGTLMRVDGDAIMLKRNTRRPEPAYTVPFTEMAKLERDQANGGMHIARAIGVGLAAGAGVFFSLVLIALQMD
jgi:hypothetical protein